SSFFILNSSFFILHSSFFILNSSFFILNSQFFILHCPKPIFLKDLLTFWTQNKLCQPSGLVWVLGALEDT
ncbi:MAG TPA: hypothetical protein PKZ53_10405, partial [Acidobacteriota bacterium]|nr:hypothetical protein [Acidobacteriota bacterium]